MGAFSEESALVSVDAYSRNIFNSVCFLFIEGGTGIFGFAVLVFIVVYGFSVFLAFGFGFREKY